MCFLSVLTQIKDITSSVYSNPVSIHPGNTPLGSGGSSWHLQSSRGSAHPHLEVPGPRELTGEEKAASLSFRPAPTLRERSLWAQSSRDERHSMKDLHRWWERVIESTGLWLSPIEHNLFPGKRCEIDIIILFFWFVSHEGKSRFGNVK